MTNLIKASLEEAKNTKEIVSIHLDPANQSECSVGFVEQLSNSEIRLLSISREGEEAGHEVRQLKDIYRVDIGGKYEKKIGFLNSKYEDIFCTTTLGEPEQDTALILATLKEAKEKELIVVLWTEDPDDSVIGYIKNITSDGVKILSVDDYGDEDGTIVLELEKITAMDCSSRKAQVIRFLNKNRSR